LLREKKPDRFLSADPHLGWELELQEEESMSPAKPKDPKQVNGDYHRIQTDRLVILGM